MDSLESLVIATAESARDPFVIERIRRAEALFMAGGDQWNYMRVWRASPVRAAVQELIDRGVPVGGTSAGLAVLGQFVFTAAKDTVTSAQALADPYDERVTIGVLQDARECGGRTNLWVVEPGGQTSVAGAGAVCLRRAAGRPEVCRSGMPFTLGTVDVYESKAGGWFDCKECND